MKKGVTLLRIIKNEGICKKILTFRTGNKFVTGFTLIELILTIGILGVIAVTAVLTINPMEYLRQSRDTRRVGDVRAIDGAILAAIANSPNIAQGAAQKVYLSIPDTAANCPSLTVVLPVLPTGWTYNCATSANNKKTDGAGWIPINFDALPAKSPLTSLPVDPINDASKGLYYIYIPGGSYSVSAMLESDKYLKESAAKDEGFDPGRFEQGSDLKLLASAQGLVGYWPLNEGSGAIAQDASGNGNNGTWNGAGVHYGAGKQGYAGQFSAATNDYVEIPTTSVLNGNIFTVSAWMLSNDITQEQTIVSRNGPFFLRVSGSRFRIGVHTGAWTFLNGAALSSNSWYHLVLTYDGSTMKSYINGVQDLTAAKTGSLVSFAKLYLGRPVPVGEQYPMNGRIDDVRIYGRALTAPEIQAIYNAYK